METQHEKVYVVVRKDVEEGLGPLRWALKNWSSQPVLFVVIHVSSGSKDLVLTPFGKSPSNSVNDERLRGKEEVILRNEKSEEPVHKILVGLISSHGIKKLVMGIPHTKSLSWKAKSEISGACYVHKHKPEFCELFMVSGGKQVFHKEEKDEGGYLEDERGDMIADFRKKSKVKGRFIGWLSRKMTDNASNNMDEQNSSHHCLVSSVDAGESVADELSDRWDDNAEEIESYVECLLASGSEELELGNQFVDQISMVQTTRIKPEALKAMIEEGEKMIEEKKIEAKAEEGRRKKAERVISLCNQRTEDMEALKREELAKGSHLQEELDSVTVQLQEASCSIAENNAELRSMIDQEGKLMIKLQAYSLEKSWVEAEITKAESESADMLRKMEETRRQRDDARRRTAFYKERDGVAATTNNLNSDYREFSEEELREASNNFSEEMVISTGQEGAVYRGSIGHTSVAIQFKTAFCLQSQEAFKAQVQMLHRIRHPNILAMVGACTDRRCIVFEHMPYGSLHDALFPSSPNQPLYIPWHVRIRIAADLCCALGFIHSSWPHPTAHGHLTSADVLLNRSLTAKIAIFRSPGFANPGSDLVSVGQIILELLMGREAVDTNHEVRRSVEERGLLEILDRAAGNWPLDIATEFARIGLKYSAEEIKDEMGVKLTEEMIREVEELRVKAESRMVDGGATCGEEKVVEVPDVFLCPILQEVMKEPQVAADGFSYELDAIKEWLDSGHETSPMTNLKLKHKRLTPNYTLSSLIRDWHPKSEAR